ncbi:MAG: hypothetical protein A3B68_01765 [Candidatus Melainabacteria bacterium RIFCSPHIGHO2_02_FULL_34_12]|nr:MAG: hypothetical protein A3B68_01765 [Candidatus Melainabacteria bacterium RIFCSPHIGHO2_02_FULL_34_12]
MILFPNAKNIFSKKLEKYINNLQKLFDSMSKSTNSNVIIDSSKSTVYSYILSLLDNVDLYFIHLIRDPRGIAYSRQKRLIQPDKERIIYMEQYGPFRSSLMWDVRNLTSEILWRKDNSHYLMLRYEDFINYPKETIKNILKLINEENKNLPFISDTEVNLNTNHSVWGNPSRFKTGVVKLKLDEEWKEKLKPIDKIISTLITLPLLKKYNYLLN